MSQFNKYMEIVNEGKNKSKKPKKSNDNPYDYAVQPEDMYKIKFTPAGQDNEVYYSPTKMQEIHNKRMAELDRQEAMSNAGYRIKTDYEKKQEKLKSDISYDQDLKKQGLLPHANNLLKTFLKYVKTDPNLKNKQGMANTEVSKIKKMDNFKKFLGEKGWKEFWRSYDEI